MTSAISSQQKNVFVAAENSGQQSLQQVATKSAVSFIWAESIDIP
jgi:hypothetical protein